MTIIYANEQNVNVRIRRRRRRLCETRRERISGMTRRILIITCISMFVAFGGYFGIHNEGTSGMKIESGAYAAEATIYKSVIVYAGDTIWGIASTYTEPSSDVRKLVREICDLNGVTPGKIYPGQVLMVPVKAHLA